MKNLVLQRLTNLMYTDGEIEIENNVLKLVKQETKFDKILKSVASTSFLVYPRKKQQYELVLYIEHR
ncbi:hypothetical protein F3K44_15680 [Bacillus megaterium]|nr:hypothetical protein [Priestia megaterium]